MSYEKYKQIVWKVKGAVKELDKLPAERWKVIKAVNKFDVLPANKRKVIKAVK